MTKEAYFKYFWKPRTDGNFELLLSEPDWGTAAAGKRERKK
jgi:hypothetical protein